MTRIGFGLALMLAVGVPGTAPAQQTNAQQVGAPALDPADPPAIVSTSADRDNRVTVPVRIGGKGPYAFVVDTGSQRTVISRELADSLKLTPDRSVRVLSMTGLSDVETVTISDISFGATRMAPVQAPVFSGVHLGGPGLLGLDGLRAKRLVLDFRSSEMRITASEATPQRAEPDVIVVTARSHAGQLILMDSQAEGYRVQIILDTGSEYSIGNAALLRKLSKRQPKRFAGPVTMTSVTGDTMIGQWGVLDKIQIGSITMTKIPVVFAEASPFAELGLSNRPALLLGVNALRGFDRVAIDFGRKRVDFLLPDQGALPSTRLAALSPLIPVD